MYCCSKIRVSKVVTYLLVLALTFLLGIVSNSIFSRYLTARRANSLYEDRVEEWHRLYEAAGMTGDSETMSDVRNHLLCATPAGDEQGVFIEVDDYVFCRKRVGSDQVLRSMGKIRPPVLMTEGTVRVLRTPSDNTDFFKLIIKSHLQWSMQNMEFLKSVNSADKARDYVQQHRWPH